MATILNNAPYMGFPLSIKRGNPAPVDTTAVWYDKTELETYAASGATAYVGQILTLVADSKCEAYMISNEAGTLIKLASTTASGDLAGDVATLQSQVANLIAAVGKKAAGEEPATGIYKEIADVIILANSKVASVKAADKSITVAGTATEPTVKVALSAAEGNALELAADGLKVTIPEVTIPAYSMKKLDTATSGMSASYQLTKDGAGIGAIIDIPKDMVVESGTVETFIAGHLPTGVTEPGTYIVLTLANATNDKLYIPASGLIEYVTGGSGENDAIQINVTADTHKVTATVKEGSLTKTMLSDEVQGLLTKANTAVQVIAPGSANGNISVDGKDVAVAGLADAAYATVASLNTTAQGYADNAKTDIIGNDKTDTADSKTIEGVKKYAHGQAVAAQEGATKAAEKLVNDLDVTDTAVDGKIVSAVSQTDGKISVTRRALVEADIPDLAQSKISGLETALAGKQDTITFDGIYHASTNKAATVSTVNTAADNLRHTLGGADGKTEIDTKDSETIKGAKLYADNAVKTLNDTLAPKVTKLEDTHAAKTGGGFKTVAEEVTDGIDALNLSGTYAAKSLETTVANHIGNTTVHITADERTKWNAASTQSETNKTAIETLNGNEETAGSVSQKVKAAKDELNLAILAKADDFSDKATFTNKGLKFIGAPSTILDLGECGFSYGTRPNSSGRNEGYIEPVVVSDIFLEGFKVKDAKITADESIVNKKYVTDAITTATAGLTGAMHFKGKLDTLPAVTDYDAGDVVIVGKKEYVLLDDKGTKSWSLLGDEGSYAVKGSIADADIADNAAIAQSKISGLTDALAAKLDATTAASTYVAKETGKSLIADTLITKLSGIDTGAQVNKIESIKAGGTALTITDKSVNIPVASDSAFGVIKVDNTSIKSTNGTIAIKAVSTDLLTQGTQTLILNCGGATD